MRARVGPRRDQAGGFEVSVAQTPFGGVSLAVGGAGREQRLGLFGGDEFYWEVSVHVIWYIVRCEVWVVEGMRLAG